MVVTARNDDHGGNLLRRMQIFLTALAEQVEKHSLVTELVLVEWNPLSDKPSLSEALLWPRRRHWKARIIKVPSEIHARFQHSDRLPLFQMIAKNVGIRRAEGRFILCTNIDVLFTEQLIGYLATRSLQPEFMYRIDRYDVPADVPVGGTIEDVFDYCRDNFIRVNSKDGTFRRDEIHRIWLRRARRIAKYLLSFLPRFSFVPLTLSSITHFIASRAILVQNGYRFISRLLFPPYPRLHTNACGDFTLMAREHWHSLRGYPELEMYSFNLDSVLCQMAYQHGVREKILRDPKRMYHIEHSAGWTPEGDRKMREWLKASGIPMLEFPEYESWAILMQKERRPMVFNNAEWGLASEHLPEETIE